jgi:DNA invertase Pin-like site-specific DNA recombinase
MISDDAAEDLRSAHAEFERLRGRAWLDRVRIGLEYRRAMRGVEEGISRVRQERDRRVREAVGGGASYREVARALGLSHSRVQQIVNEGRKGEKAGAGASGPR